MRLPVRPELPTASVVRGQYIDHDRRRGQLCTFTNPPQSHLSIGVKLFKSTKPLLLAMAA
jgi:hypothetical protein